MTVKLSLNSTHKQDKAVFYRPIKNEVEVFEAAYRNKLPLLLKGPTGTGKSRFVEFMASRLKLSLVTVSCHEETSAVDLIGRYLIQGSETVWQDGPLTTSIRKGGLIYIDEIAEARPDTIVALHALTDHRRTLFIDRTNENLTAPPEFMLVASYNPGYQHITKELKASTKQRFVSIAFSYPPPEIETEVLMTESGCEADIAKSLVKLAKKIRALEALALSETVSTRLLVNAAKLIVKEIPQRAACEIAIAQPLSDEPDTVLAIKDLIALIF